VIGLLQCGPCIPWWKKVCVVGFRVKGNQPRNTRNTRKKSFWGWKGLVCLYGGVCCDESVGVLMILAGLVYFRVFSVFRGKRLGL